MMQSSHRRVSTLLAALATVALFSGCEQRKYAISMHRLADGKVARDLTVSTADDGKPKETPKAVLDALRKAYGEGESQPDEKTHFSKTFDGALPADTEHDGFSGHAMINTVVSPLGTTCYYLERAPGPTDPLAMLDAARETLDIALRAVLAYLENLDKFKEKPEVIARLRTFVMTDLKHDATNVMLLTWPAFHAEGAAQDAAHKESHENEVWGRVLAYLHEHGYADDAHFSGLDMERIVSAGLRRRLAPVLGDSARDLMPTFDALLSEGSGMGDAIESGLKRIGVSEEDFKAKSEMAFRSMTNSTSISMSVKTGAKPTLTNGEWDAAGSKVSWEVEAVAPPMIPPTMYAIWPEPNDAFQKAHFGRVLLSEKLVDYNDWRAGLEDADRQRWDAFVDGLKPSQSLADRLNEFEGAETKRQSAASTQPSVGPLQGGIELLRAAANPG